MIERIAGARPRSCPWRVLYEPIVHEVVGVMAFAADGNLGAALGPDPTALLAEACRVYQTARNATRNENERLAAEKHEQAMRAAKGAR